MSLEYKIFDKEYIKSNENMLMTKNLSCFAPKCDEWQQFVIMPMAHIDTAYYTLFLIVLVSARHKPVL